eukprot:403355733
MWYLFQSQPDKKAIYRCEYFWLAYEFIKEALDNNECVLVHCLKGMSRSATIVISYVMISQDMPAKEAAKFVSKKHPKTFPNPHFILELEELEKQIKSGNKIQKLPFEMQNTNQITIHNSQDLLSALNLEEEEKQVQNGIEINNQNDSILEEDKFQLGTKIRSKYERKYSDKHEIAILEKMMLKHGIQKEIILQKEFIKIQKH